MNLTKTNTVSIITIAIAAALISGCQSSGTAGSGSAVSSADIVLVAAEKPAADPVGTQIQVLRKGKPITYSVTAVDGDTESGEGSDGCRYTELNRAYAPSLQWENCSGSSGSQTITKTVGSPWPMSLETKFSYKFNGSSDTDSWSGTRKCKVDGIEKVTTQMGEFDTYKVVCKDPWSKYTWWYAPEIERNVKLNRKHYKNSSRNYDIETVSVTTGS